MPRNIMIYHGELTPWFDESQKLSGNKLLDYLHTPCNYGAFLAHELIWNNDTRLKTWMHMKCELDTEMVYDVLQWKKTSNNKSVAFGLANSSLDLDLLSYMASFFDKSQQNTILTLRSDTYPTLYRDPVRRALVEMMIGNGK